MPLKLKEGGNFLRNRRKALSMTIEDVKKATGLETSDISRMENGRVTSPSLDKAITYGVYLGTTPNEIARAYGLWNPPKRERLVQIAQQLEKLPEEEAERLLETLAAIVRDTLYGQGARARSGVDI